MRCARFGHCCLTAIKVVTGGGGGGGGWVTPFRVEPPFKGHHREYPLGPFKLREQKERQIDESCLLLEIQSLFHLFDKAMDINF